MPRRNGCPFPADGRGNILMDVKLNGRLYAPVRAVIAPIGEGWRKGVNPPVGDGRSARFHRMPPFKAALVALTAWLVLTSSGSATDQRRRRRRCRVRTRLGYKMVLVVPSGYGRPATRKARRAAVYHDRSIARFQRRSPCPPHACSASEHGETGPEPRGDRRHRRLHLVLEKIDTPATAVPLVGGVSATAPAIRPTQRQCRSGKKPRRRSSRRAMCISPAYDI